MMKSLKTLITEKLKINKNTLPDTSFDNIIFHPYWQNKDNDNRIYVSKLTSELKIHGFDIFKIRKYPGINPLFADAQVTYFRLVDVDEPDAGLAVRCKILAGSYTTIDINDEERFTRYFGAETLSILKKYMDKIENK